jgi:hypothetical protein
VRFASERPLLYVAVLSRFLLGADIPAARQARESLLENIRAIDVLGQLAMPPEAAADLAWATAHAAATLFVTASAGPPGDAVIAALRDNAFTTILKT